MKLIKAISLTILILFTALQPVAYADCCEHLLDEPASCCVLKLKSGAKHKATEKAAPQNCHEKPHATTDGKPVFSCCKHIPLQNPDFTPTDSRSIQKSVEQVSENVLTLTFILNEVLLVKHHYEHSGSACIQSPPIWLMQQNFRC
jgi:hypothetical protein